MHMTKMAQAASLRLCYLLEWCGMNKCRADKLKQKPRKKLPFESELLVCIHIILH